MTNEEIKKMAEELNTGQLNSGNLTRKFFEASRSITDEALNNEYCINVMKMVEKDLKHWINSIFTYMHDFKSISFSNATPEINRFVSLYNFRNSMIITHSVASRIKNNLGKVAYLVSIDGKNVLTEAMEVVGNPTKSGNEIVDVWLTKNYISLNNSIEMRTVYRLYLENGIVKTEKWMFPIKDNNVSPIMTDTSTILGISYIPIVIDYANEEGRPSWEPVSSLINFYGSFESKMQIEFEYVKTQLKLNPQWSDKNAREIQKEIEGGDIRVHEDFNDNSMDAISYISNGGITTDIARGIRDSYKEQIKEQIFLISQSSGGNNKHTTEAINDNIYSYSFAWFKKNIFGETLSRLYWMIIDISNRVGNTRLSLPDYLECDAQLARPLELALNLNANGKEQDAPTTVSVREDTVKTIDGGK